MTKTFTHYLIMALLLFGAIACYTLSFQAGTFALILVGAGLELTLWIKFFRKRR